jgi:hypothetical protein
MGLPYLDRYDNENSHGGKGMIQTGTCYLAPQKGTEMFVT